MNRIGILSFFPAFNPPRSGGELRLHYISRQLAHRGFDIEMASPTHGGAPDEVIEHERHFREHRFPKPRFYNRTHHVLDRVAKFRECSGLVCALVGRRHTALRAEAERLAREVDVYTQESPFLSPLIPRRRKRGQLLVYNSYNVETRMAGDMFGSSIQGRMATAYIRRLERNLLREADVVLACSQEDVDIFANDFGIERAKMTVIPNGVDLDAVTPCMDPARRLEARELLGLSNSRPACFFIGSYHPPNIEAVDLIAQSLAIHMPEVDFLIAGKVCDAFANRPLPENMRLMGLIDEAQKAALLDGADAALNPVTSGSGTNLKILEYFSAGLPVLATPHGSRGLGIEHRRHALVAPPESLLEGLEELLGDSTLQDLLGREARRLVEEEFGWQSIGDRVADLYTLKLRRRIIIMNDYPVWPAEQGGQVRVEAVARRLSDAGMGVTLLTLTAEPKGRRVQMNERLEELNVPRGATHRRIDALLSHFVGCGADDVTALLFTRLFTKSYGRILRHELERAEGVMLSHPYLACFLKKIPKNKKVYYDSHNTEWQLKHALYTKSFLSRYLIHRVRRAEMAACQRSAATFCVSDENRHHLMSLVPGLNGRSHVCPNGVDCSQVNVLSSEERRRLRRRVGFGREFVAIFLGSGHPPNAEAARLIIEEISPDHPRVLFLLVGSVSGWFWNRYLPGNVMLMGMVSTPVKDFLLETADFALNPMLTGSGTSLKLFDYLASGLPVLSTAIGARGLDEEARQCLVMLEREQFSKGLRELLGNPEECARLSRCAREFAENRFDWSVTLNDMERVILNPE